MGESLKEVSLVAQAVKWRAVQETADRHRAELREMVRSANATGVSKYRINKLLHGYVSEPTIAKWCASERGTV